MDVLLVCSRAVCQSARGWKGIGCSGTVIVWIGASLLTDLQTAACPCSYNIVGGNHDLEGIDEFPTDEANLEAYLSILGKETPQFAHEIAPKVLVVGLGSTQFRTAQYTSHEVAVDQAQIEWFEKTIAEHPEEDGWQIFVFSHAPIIGSALRVLQVLLPCLYSPHADMFPPDQPASTEP